MIHLWFWVPCHANSWNRSILHSVNISFRCHLCFAYLKRLGAWHIDISSWSFFFYCCSMISTWNLEHACDLTLVTKDLGLWMENHCLRTSTFKEVQAAIKLLILVTRCRFPCTYKQFVPAHMFLALGLTLSAGRINKYKETEGSCHAY